MVRVLDDLLEVLKGGDWHDFKELAAKTPQLNENQLEFILSFLRSYDFIERERKRWSLRTKRVRLNPLMMAFLGRIDELGKT